VYNCRTGHTAGVHSLAFDGRSILLGGGFDFNIIGWDLDNVLDIPDATQSTYMDDVDDGAKVRGLVLKHGIDILDAFLLSLTTDGIALNKHANNSVIPLVVRVLNFPPYLRAKYVSLAIIACSKPSSQIMKYQVLS
jgi:hypothetical protein